MEERSHLFEIFQRYLDGSASEEEVTELMSYIADPLYAGSVQKILGDAFDKHEGKRAIEPDKLQLMLEEIFKHNELSHPNPSAKTIRLWRRLAIAASFILVLSAIGLLFIGKHQPQSVAIQPPPDNTIAPGGNKAILTLANGSQIALTDATKGRLAVQGNTTITKTADGEVIYHADHKNRTAVIQYNTMSTPRGGQYHLVLSDGTGVWLNAASSIKYPTAFSGSYRTVETTGEAWFEVAHDPHMPFRVIAANQTIEDIGTSFDINAYTDEPAQTTTLIKGAVKVSTAGNTTGIKLTPGQQGTSLAGNILLKSETVDVESVTAWRDGYFRFNNADMGAIMRQFARWYDIEVEYQGKMSTHEFMGKISRNSSLERVLKILGNEGIHYKIEGKKLIILP